MDRKAYQAPAEVRTNRFTPGNLVFLLKVLCFATLMSVVCLTIVLGILAILWNVGLRQ